MKVTDLSQPFNGIKTTTFQDSNSTWLELVDGSANQENMPLTPLFVNIRAVDVVVAVDASSDDDNLWVK
jgi:lysophospholipase